MVKVGLFVRLEAKSGREKEIESFLMGGLPMVVEEPATIAWFGIRFGPSTFGKLTCLRQSDPAKQAHPSAPADALASRGRR